MIYLTQDKLDDAITEFQQAIQIGIEIDSANTWSYYNLACVYSLKNEQQKALESLQKVIDLDKRFFYNSTFRIGYSKTDPDFDNIRQTPEYQQLINSD